MARTASLTIGYTPSSITPQTLTEPLGLVDTLILDLTTPDTSVYSDTYSDTY